MNKAVYGLIRLTGSKLPTVFRQQRAVSIGLNTLFSCSSKAGEPTEIKQKFANKKAN